MTVYGSTTPRPERSHVSLGVLGAALGFVTIAAVVVIGVISFTAFNPPGWVRIGTVALFAACWLASVTMDVLGLRHDARAAAIVGLVLCGLSAVGLIIMIAVAG